MKYNYFLCLKFLPRMMLAQESEESLIKQDINYYTIMFFFKLKAFTTYKIMSYFTLVYVFEIRRKQKIFNLHSLHLIEAFHSL